MPVHVAAGTARAALAGAAAGLVLGVLQAGVLHGSLGSDSTTAEASTGSGGG